MVLTPCWLYNAYHPHTLDDSCWCIKPGWHVPCTMAKFLDESKADILRELKNTDDFATSIK